MLAKSDASFHFCTDYRKVNRVTKSDSFPLPRTEDCVDRVGVSKFVSKLDLLKGYWQVPLTARACEISAFVTSDDFLQYAFWDAKCTCHISVAYVESSAMPAQL